MRGLPLVRKDMIAQEIPHEPGDDEAEGLKRREFLQLMGISFAALAGGCKLQPPKDKVIPSMLAAEEVLPGRSVWYSTVCGACPARCGALAKVRDGRPIKLEGNPEHPASQGGLCARGQGSLLDLYDSLRFEGPVIGGNPGDWGAADLAVVRALERARVSGKAVRLLTGVWPSPTARGELSRLRARFPSLRRAVLGDASLTASLEAHGLTHGRRAVPTYHLEKARTIVSVDADFLGTWGSPVQFSKAWASRRKPDAELNLMSWHAQFEARLSPTGANADLRVPIRPSERHGTLVSLGRLVAQKLGWAGPLPPAANTSVERSVLLETADALCRERKRSLVLCGAEDSATQAAANWLNHMLGAYEAGVAELGSASALAEEGDLSFDHLLDEMERGEVAVLIVRGCNPAQNHPAAARFRQAAAKVGLVVSLAGRPDETSALAGVVAPEPHPLETWTDDAAHAGVWGLSQPTIAPMRQTRDAVESLARWDGRSETAHDLIRRHWRAEVWPKTGKGGSFEKFWEGAVRAGLTERPNSSSPGTFNPGALPRLRPPEASSGDFEFVAYAGAALGDGAQANNPWLQELPDPVTKITWGNAASFSPADAKKLGLVEGRVVRLSARGVSLELPAHIQPGQAPGTIAAALGYGRSGVGPIAGNYPTRKMFPLEFEPAGGADAMPLRGASGVVVEPQGRLERLAKTQRYDHLVDPFMGERRNLAREATLADYALDHRAGNPAEKDGGSLWKEHEYEGHRWGMAVDLNSCTGCSACVLSCNLENNVPVVGKAEVAKGREMHWLRIDRYYSGAPDSDAASPEVSFQPMLCQHCGNAPCETVCPVLVRPSTHRASTCRSTTAAWGPVTAPTTAPTRSGASTGSTTPTRTWPPTSPSTPTSPSGPRASWKNALSASSGSTGPRRTPRLKTGP